MNKNIKTTKTMKKVKPMKKVKSIKKSDKNVKTIKQLIKNKTLKEPEKLRVGYVSKEINSKRYIVRLDNNKKKYFAVANKQEIACYLKLKENLNKFISIYKTGNSSFKSIKNAISFAIRETEKEFPKCTTSNRKYNRKLENRTRTRVAYDNYNYYKNYWYYRIKNYLSTLKFY
jgi:hypothetical protein